MRSATYVATLSNDCHYHPYHMVPTATELSGWIEAVATLLETIETTRGQTPLHRERVSRAVLR